MQFFNTSIDIKNKWLFPDETFVMHLIRKKLFNFSFQNFIENIFEEYHFKKIFEFFLIELAKNLTGKAHEIPIMDFSFIEN